MKKITSVSFSFILISFDKEITQFYHYLYDFLLFKALKSKNFV